MQTVPLHLGPSAWDGSGRLFAIAYPDKLMVADSGRVEDLVVRHVFVDEPTDVRGLFIAADNSIFVGLKGCVRGSFGRTLRSRDSGYSFIEVLARSFWGMDQDCTGNLFIGCYHERGEPNQECAVYMSTDGARWINLAAPEWQKQTHVHGLAICPDNGWLYATLGDQDGFDGCWRMRRRTLRLVAAVTAGASEISLLPDDDIATGLSAVLHDETGEERVEIASSSHGTVQLAAPLSRAYGSQARLELLDWVNKFRSPKADAQYIGIAFKDGWVYLSDDNPAKKNPRNAVVYRARDDGTDKSLAPLPVLVNDADAAWGAFFLRQDNTGRLWVAIRPYQGKGRLWYTKGKKWQLALETPEELLEEWRMSHTFRDMSYGLSGDGRCMFSAKAQALLPKKSHALMTSGNTHEQRGILSAIKKILGGNTHDSAN